MDGMDMALPFHGTMEMDLVNFGVSLSFNICKFGQWAELLDRAKYPGLVILLGSGGVVLYFAKQSQKQKTDKTDEHENISWMSGQSVLKWIFESDEESEEFYDSSFSTFLKGYNLGLLLPQVNNTFSYKIPTGRYSDDLGLNSLTEKSQPQKFLKHPLLYNKEESVKSNIDKGSGMENLENRSGSRFIRNNRLMYNMRMKRPEDKLVIQRSVASNRLSFKFSEPGCDLRMDGDGCENTDNLVEIGVVKKSFRGQSPQVKCIDPVCKIPHCLEDKSKVDRSNAMLEFVQNAEEVRRLIRETSFDSTASDFYAGINIQFDKDEDVFNNYQGLYSLEDVTQLDMDTEDTEEILDKGGVSDKYMWRITDLVAVRESSADSELSCTPHLNNFPICPSSSISKVLVDNSSNVSEAGDDVSSYVGSGLDAWEWDDDCYYGDDNLTSKLDQDQFEQNTYHQSWLPDDDRELDLESELGGKDLYNVSTRSSRSPSKSSSRSKINYRRLPPSGSSSLEREPDQD